VKKDGRSNPHPTSTSTFQATLLAIVMDIFWNDTAIVFRIAGKCPSSHLSFSRMLTLSLVHMPWAKKLLNSTFNVCHPLACHPRGRENC